MQNQTSGLHSLAARIERLERQNRQARTICLPLVILLVLVAVACQSYPVKVLEAQKFLLRDRNGKVRVEIDVSYDTDSGGVPSITMFDQAGKVRTLIGGGVLNISGEGGSAVLLEDTLQFNGEGGVTARLGAEGRARGGSLWLFGKEVASSIMLNSESPVLELEDGNGFRSDLGSNELTNTRTGAKSRTSAASLVLTGKDDKVLWSAPYAH